MLSRLSRPAVAAALLIGTLGGCPLAPESTADVEGLSSTPAALIGTGSSAEPDAASQVENPVRSTSPGSDFQTSLQAEFPDCNEPARAALWRDRVLQLVNQARGEAGLGPVRRSAVLEQQATEYACEMITYDFFAHVNPVTESTLSERAADFDYAYQAIGENLAAGQLTPEEAFADWMDSEGHRANILEPSFTELGVGVRAGGRYGLYWVQEFGHPR